MLLLKESSYHQIWYGKIFIMKLISSYSNVFGHNMQITKQRYSQNI